MEFPVQHLPGLAFREVVQSMTPWDILHLTQTSYRTQCHVSRNAKLPIDLLVDASSPQSVSFQFRGSDEPMIKIVVISPPGGFEHPDTRHWQFGKASAIGYREHCEYRGWFVDTQWKKASKGTKAIIDFFVDTFKVNSVSFENSFGRPRAPYELLKYIESRKLSLGKITWTSGETDQAVIPRVLELAIKAKELEFELPDNKRLNFNRFGEFKLDYVKFDYARWMTRDILCALNNCSVVEVDDSMLTGEDYNGFLKHLISNPGKATKWEIVTHQWVEWEVVMNGIEHKQIRKNEKCIVKRSDGEEMKVVFRGATTMRARYVSFILEVNVLDGSDDEEEEEEEEEDEENP